jgi:hypothetical protein
MSPEALYAELGHLIETMPGLAVPSLTEEHHRWFGRAHALLNVSGDFAGAFALQGAVDEIILWHPNTSQLGRARVAAAAARITTALYRALAAAELKAPVNAQGAFIPAGNSFDAFAALAKVLGGAREDVLIVDPYMDEKALIDFAPLAPEGVSMRLLADQQTRKATLEPAQQRWTAQYGAQRPLEIRLAPARALHDRALIVDREAAWTLTQSLNAFAARSPAMIVRVVHETAVLKIAAYEDIWTASAVMQ